MIKHYVKALVTASLLLAMATVHAQTGGVAKVGGAPAAKTNKVDNSGIEALRAILKKKFPQNPEPQSIATTPVPGIFEVVLGPQITYVDASGSYFFFGAQLVELAKQRNITQERSGEIYKVSADKFNVKDAIVRVNGKGERKLYLWTDPHCPYCQKLEEELPKLSNVTIYTFLMPRPSAMAVAQSIWCHATPDAAWVNYMKSRVEPESKQCGNPIQRNVDFAKTIMVSGTPTLFKQDGQRLSGYVQADAIERFIAGDGKKD